MNCSRTLTATTSAPPQPRSLPATSRQNSSSSGADSTAPLSEDSHSSTSALNTPGSFVCTPIPPGPVVRAPVERKTLNLVNSKQRRAILQQPSPARFCLYDPDNIDIGCGH